ncbi:uncharacterized protein LOC119766138 [Culex quinquefasciatus]|uniref:uncharacterized protein LOC119766138 n=1 Tax=Culex quinquefasciatus TaxID=7176 RepID=UPI0018E377C8|nr:uncharacterized protein LOC119766138 [Culex quinquefasciatus]
MPRTATPTHRLSSAHQTPLFVPTLRKNPACYPVSLGALIRFLPIAVILFRRDQAFAPFNILQDVAVESFTWESDREWRKISAPVHWRDWFPLPGGSSNPVKSISGSADT